jgi:hypothetical protein
VEAVEKSQINGVHRWGEGSDGQWRWRRGPVVLVRKREGEDGLNWGQRWRMGGSHREAAEPVALRRNRRGGGVSSGRSRQGGRVGSGEGGKEGAGGGRRVFKHLHGAWRCGEKGGGPAATAAWQREKEERGPWTRRSTV